MLFVKQRDVDIPDNVKTYRTAILTQLEKIETAISLQRHLLRLRNFFKIH